jgi:hypothetical protein
MHLNCHAIIATKTCCSIATCKSTSGIGEEGKMKREEMKQKIANELMHIPNVKGNLHQNLFRSGYNAIRCHDLAENPETPTSISFVKVLEQARKTDPSFLPIYDVDFFPDV